MTVFLRLKPLRSELLAALVSKFLIGLGLTVAGRAGLLIVAICRCGSDDSYSVAHV